MKNTIREDNVTYIVFYEVYDCGDNVSYWEDRYYEFETYNELIEHCADMVFNFGNEIRLQSIFKIGNNMLDLFGKDIVKRIDELREEKEQKILLKKKQKEKREAQMEEERESKEYALYKELYRKYGNGEVK